MFDRTIFIDQIKPIAIHYKHEMSEPILKIYYEHLSENLTEEEFIQAMKQSVVKLPAYRGLPSAEQFVELILGSRESKALQEWQIILQAASRNDSEALTYLSNRGHIALSGIGGLNIVAFHEGSLQWIQKDFIQLYCQCSDRDVKVLKQAPAPDPRPKPVADEDLITPEQWRELRDRMKNFGRSGTNET